MGAFGIYELVKVCLIVLTAITATAAVAAIADEVSQNSGTVIGGDISDNIVTSTTADSEFESNVNVDMHLQDSVVSISMDSLTSNNLASELYIFYKRKKAAPRIKNKSKKEAKEKAFLKGGKRKPIHHPDGKFGPHYHPNDPKFSHWHYYYLWLILFARDSDE